MTTAIENIPETTELPAPGIYPGVEDKAYRAWPALSKSVLEYGMETMEHLKAAIDGKITRKDTDAFQFGRNFHCRVLEPARFHKEYATIPVFEQDTPGKYANYTATNEYKAKLAAWEAAHEGMEQISLGDANKIEAMAKQVYSHPAVKLFRAAGGCEVSATWTDPGTGLSLKGRLDKWIEGFKGCPTIIDVKTVESCHPDKLEKSIRDFGWARQAAMYKNGIEAITGEEPDFLFVFCEKKEPFSVCVARLSDDAVNIGREQIKGILQRYKHAQETGIYAGWGNGILTLELPAYEMKRYANLSK